MGRNTGLVSGQLSWGNITEDPTRLGYADPAAILVGGVITSYSIHYTKLYDHEKVLRKVGADEVINLEIEEGVRIASRLIAPEVADRIPVAEDISLAEVFLPPDFGVITSYSIHYTKLYDITGCSLVVEIQEEEPR